MRRSVIVLVLLFCCTWVTPGLSLEFGDSLQLHGFVSQGYLQSSNNHFLGDSRSGSFKMSEVAVNANWRPLAGLRIGVQGFYRNLGDFSEDEVVLDWGLLEYQPFDALGVRLGKVKMPLGLYNEVRDVPALLPMVFLPQSIYDESRRDANLGYIGAGLFGNLDCGSWGDLDYHFFTGEADIPDQSILQQNNEDSAIAVINRNNNLPVNKQNPLIPATFESLERESEDLYGAALVYNTPWNIRLGATLLHSKSEVFLNGSSRPVGDTVVHHRFVVSLEYSRDNWLFVSEYGETDRTSNMFGNESLDGPSQSWYAMLCYSPWPSWTFSLLYDEFYRLKHDKHSDDRPQAEPATGWRKDIGVGIRYDVNDWCNLKAEYHYVDGMAMQLGVVNDNIKRYWSYSAAKLSVMF